MKKFTETIADDDYRNSDGLLVCGRCGTPKEMRLSTELLGGHTAIVPIPCECMKRAEAERRERELAAERKRKIERARTECFAGCDFFRGCTFDADDGRTPQIAAICKGYADTFSRDDMNGLLLWGKVGTGKSFYASAIANRVIDLGFSALQTSVHDIVTHIESVPFNEREKAKSRLLKYDLLVIDDLGAHRSTDYVMGHGLRHHRLALQEPQADDCHDEPRPKHRYEVRCRRRPMAAHLHAHLGALRTNQVRGREPPRIQDDGDA